MNNSTSFVNTSMLNEAKFGQFLKDNDLMDKWRQYIKPKVKTYDGDPKGWKENPDRPVAELRQALNQSVDRTRLVSGNGLLKIDFEVLHKENVQNGMKLNVEMKGEAKATGKLQVRRLLEDLSVSSKRDLTQQGYLLKINYGSLYVTENKDENLDFMVMATVFYKGQGNG